MRLLYLTALLLYLSCVSAQDTTPEISLNELPCEDILFVNRNGFDGIVGGSPTSSDCVLPEDFNGRSKLTATLFNIGNPLLPESSTLFDELDDLDACVAIKWEVTGGVFIGENGEIPSVPSTETQLCAITHAPGYVGPAGSCNDVCSAGLSTDAEISPFGDRIYSTVWIKWNENLHDPNAKYGVKVSIIVKSKLKGKIKFKDADPFGLRDIEIGFERNQSRTLCETFIPLGVNTNNVTLMDVSEPNCAGNGTRTVNINLAGQITRWVGFTSPAFPVAPWYRVVVQRKVGGSGYETVTVFDSPTQTTLSVDVSGLTYEKSHAIRVLEYYGPMLADINEEPPYEPIQGNPYIAGLSDVYMEPGGPAPLDGIYGVSGNVGNISWVIDPPDFATFFTSAPGGVLLLGNSPIGGVVELQATGTSNACDNEVVLHKQICIHNRPTGPNNDPCSSFSGNPQGTEVAESELTTRTNKTVTTNQLEEGYHLDSELDRTEPTSSKVVQVYPNPVSSGSSFFLSATHLPQPLNGHLQVQVVSLTGELVRRFDKIESGSTIEIDGKTLFPGLFILQVMDGERTLIQTEKIIIVE